MRKSESDRGTIEAGLALLPLTLFFLAVLQIIIAGTSQAMETAKLHDQVNRLLIADPLASAAQISSAAGGEVKIEQWPLGRVITVVKKVPLPIIGNFVGDHFSMRAIAVFHGE